MAQHYLHIPPAAITYLKKQDPKLGQIIDRYQLVPHQLESNLLQALVWRILGQQISNQTARNVRQKFANLVGEITSENILATAPTIYHQIGTTAQKMQWIRTLALKIKQQELILEELPQKSNDIIIKELTALPGIGPWTAQMILIFALGRLDVFPAGDLIIKKTLQKIYHLPKVTTKIIAKYQQLYAPYQTIAALYLWTFADHQKKP